MPARRTGARHHCEMTAPGPGYERTVAAWNRTTVRPRRGSGGRPSRGTPPDRPPSATCTASAAAWPATTQPRRHGAAARRNRGTPARRANLGILYRDGRGVGRDGEEAVRSSWSATTVAEPSSEGARQPDAQVQGGHADAPPFRAQPPAFGASKTAVTSTANPSSNREVAVSPAAYTPCSAYASPSSASMVIVSLRGSTIQYSGIRASA